MRKFLSFLEPRYFKLDDMVQDQYHEVFEVIFIMKGQVGVGYRLLTHVFYGKALQARDVVNDYAMLRNKVSEFIYKPVKDFAEGLSINKANW